MGVMFTVNRAGIAVALLLLAAALAAEAEPPGTPRVGLLGIGSAERSFVDALRQGLRERGWIEGQNIAFEDRSTVDRYSRLPDVAAELVRLKVDVIVTSGTTATQTVRKSTGTIPIVTVTASDPVETGLAASLAHPGGNVTGLTTGGRDLVGKRLELLRETLPGLSRIAVLWNPEIPTELVSLKNAEAAAGRLGLKVQRVEVRRPEDLERAFRSMTHGHAGALASISSTMFRAQRARIVELTARHRLPSTFPEKEYVEAGGLMSYGPEVKDTFRQLALYVDKLLKGAKPGDLPFEQPTKFGLVINLKTARMLGLKIPPSVLARADQVIE
jgi:putative ABC transport system substrate-binding protein